MCAARFLSLIKAAARASLRGALALLALAAPKAEAGAWPQEVGKIFASSGVELGFDEELYLLGSPLPVVGWSSLYIDYGLTKRLTLTIDYGREIGGLLREDTPIPEAAYLILRWDLAPEAVWRRAVSGGLGWSETGLRHHFGLHLGRGFDSHFGSGWMNADASLRSTAQGGAELGLDLVAGLNQSEALKLMSGMQVKSIDGADPVVRLTTGLAYALQKFDIELGLAYRPDAPEQSRLKLAIWQNF